MPLSSFFARWSVQDPPLILIFFPWAQHFLIAKAICFFDQNFLTILYYLEEFRCYLSSMYYRILKNSSRSPLFKKTETDFPTRRILIAVNKFSCQKTNYWGIPRKSLFKKQMSLPNFCEFFSAVEYFDAWLFVYIVFIVVWKNHWILDLDAFSNFIISNCPK